jgi:hypothetical protein
MLGAMALSHGMWLAIGREIILSDNSPCKATAERSKFGDTWLDFLRYCRYCYILSIERYSGLRS